MLKDGKVIKFFEYSVKFVRHITLNKDHKHYALEDY